MADAAQFPGAQRGRVPRAHGCGHGERRLSWADLRERVRRLAVALQAGGIEKGERVAFLAPNVTELLEAHYGVPASGATLVAINTRLTADEVASIEHSGSRVVVVDPELAHLVEGAPVERVLETLPGFKAPREIDFCELPKTSTGKIKKFELRERARRQARPPVSRA